LPFIFGDQSDLEIFNVRLSFETLPVLHFTSDHYERGQNELSNDVYVISVASCIVELEPIEVWRQIFSITIQYKSIRIISTMWP